MNAFKKTSLAGCVASLCIGSVAWAENGGVRLEEIVVTAQKRTERLLDVPIAVSAIDQAAIEKGQMRTTQDIQNMVPSLVFTSLASSATPYLRGVGSDIAQPNAEAGVATHLDGVFVSLAAVGVQDLLAVERIEVLSGPQGTLYGRNAVGGAINVITRTPMQELEAGATITVGNYSRQEFTGYVSGGLGENFAAGIYAATSARDTYYDRVQPQRLNEPRDEESDAVRIKFAWTPGDNISVVGSVEHMERENFEGGAYRNEQHNSIMLAPPFDQPAIIDEYTVVSDRPQFSKARQTGATLRADISFDAATLVSISGYRDTDFHLSSDLDGSQADFLGIEAWQKSEQFSQEIQLLSPEDAPFRWIVGAYAFEERTGFLPVDTAGAILLGAVPPLPIYHNLATSPIDTSAWALFVQATFPLTEAMNLTVGGRHSEDKKELNGASDTFTDVDGNLIFAVPYPDGSKTWRAFTPKITLDYQFADTMLYATYSKGFKSGAYNVSTPSPDLRGPVDPEKLTSYEVGSKSEFAAGRVRFETALYFYDFKNIQLQIFDPAISNSTILQNAAEAELYGLDLSLSMQVTEDLALRINGAWERGEYKRYDRAVVFVETPMGNISTSTDLTGKDMSRIPEWVFSASLDHRLPLQNGGSIDTAVSWYYNDGYNFDPAGQLAQDSYHNVNLSMGYTFPGEQVSLIAFANNLTDSHHYNSRFYGPTAILAQDAAPRMYGLTLKFDY